MGIVISIILTLTALTIAGLSVFLGYRRGILASGIKCAAVILCLLTAFIVAAPLAGTVNGAFSGAFSWVFPEELYKEGTLLYGAIQVLPGALAAPLVFALVFIVLKLITDIIFAIVMKKNDSEAAVKPAAGALAAACGLVIGLSCVFAVFVPVSGYAALADGIVEASSLPGVGATSVINITTDLIESTSNAPVCYIVRLAGGQKTFDRLTSVKLDGKDISISGEIEAIKPLLSNAVFLYGTKVEKWGQAQADALRLMPQQLGQSEFLTKLASELISAEAASLYEKGKIGDTAYSGLLISLCGAMRTSTSESVKADAATLCEAVAYLSENGAFAVLLDKNATPELITNELAKNDLLAKIMITLKSNSHFSFIIPEIIDLAFASAAEALGVESEEQVKQTAVQSISVAVTEAVNSGGEDKINRLCSALCDTFTVAFGSTDITDDDELMQALANSMAEVFAQEEEVTEGDINGYFEGAALLADAVKIGNEVVRVECGGAIFLSNVAYSKEEMLEFAEKLLIQRIGEEAARQEMIRLFGYSKSDQIRRVTALEWLFKSDTGNTAMLLSIAPDRTLLTDRVLLESIAPALDFSKLDNEGLTLLADGMLTAVRTFNNVRESLSKLPEGSKCIDIITALDVYALGDSIELLRRNGVIGENVTALAQAGLGNLLGIDIDFITLSDGTQKSLGALLGTIQDTVKLTGDITDDVLTDEQKVLLVRSYLDDLDSDSAKAIANLMSASLLRAINVPEKYAENTAKLLKELFNRLAAQEDTAKDEAEAVLQLLNIAFNARNGEGRLFGTGGRLGSADKLVERVISSSVTCETLISTCYDDAGKITNDPLAIGELMNAEDSSELKKVIHNFLEAADDQTQIKALRALAAIFAIEQ